MLTELKLGLRSFGRYRAVAALSVLGLAIGLAASLLIALYVQNELGYDSFNAKAERIYRVLREFDEPDLHYVSATTPSALAPALRTLPSVERAIRVQQSSAVVRRGRREFVEDGFLIADDGFFDVFSFPILKGAAALQRPNTLVISARAAARYFPDRNPIGDSLNVLGMNLEVTGVMADPPRNSHLQFDFVASREGLQDPLNWVVNNDWTYVLLRKGSSRAALADQTARIVAARDASRPGAGNDFVPHLQPLLGIHLGTGVPVKIKSQGNLGLIRLFALLAAMIVLLACINFANLATARASERAREVGMRKTLGARRRRLAAQFLVEALLTSAAALGLALILCVLALPWFNALTDKTLSLRTIFSLSGALALIGVVVAVGFAAGTYPAFVLSGFQPLDALKRRTTRGSSGELLRRIFVVLQLAVSIALLAATGIVLTQLHFMTTSKLGFDAGNLLIVKQAEYLDDRLHAFKATVGRLSGVQSVGAGFSVPGSFFLNSMWRPSEPGTAQHNLDYTFVDYGYLDTLHIHMAAGRKFSADRGMDSEAVVLNETAARAFGWTAAEAVGKTLTLPWATPGKNANLTVIGVVQDFHFASLQRRVHSLAIVGPRPGGTLYRAPQYVVARLAPDQVSTPDQVSSTLRAAEAVWKKFSDLPFHYAFLATDLAAQYSSQRHLSTIFKAFSALAMLIACLGLFALAAFTGDRRRREIGIRKVHGASVPRITILLLRETTILVAIAFVIAAPCAYAAMQTWLGHFAYRAEPGPQIFLEAAGLTLTVALVTVGWRAYRAATISPVEALRHE